MGPMQVCGQALEAAGDPGMHTVAQKCFGTVESLHPLSLSVAPAVYALF